MNIVPGMPLFKLWWNESWSVLSIIFSVQYMWCMCRFFMVPHTCNLFCTWHILYLFGLWWFVLYLCYMCWKALYLCDLWPGDWLPWWLGSDWSLCWGGVVRWWIWWEFSPLTRSYTDSYFHYAASCPDHPLIVPLMGLYSLCLMSCSKSLCPLKINMTFAV